MDAIALDPRLRHAAAFLGQQNGMLIDGKLVPAASGKTFPVYNPATGTVIASRKATRKTSTARSPPLAGRSMTDAGQRSGRLDGAGCCGSWPT